MFYKCSARFLYNREIIVSHNQFLPTQLCGGYMKSFVRVAAHLSHPTPTMWLGIAIHSNSSRTPTQCPVLQSTSPPQNHTGLSFLETN